MTQLYDTVCAAQRAKTRSRSSSLEWRGGYVRDQNVETTQRFNQAVGERRHCWTLICAAVVNGDTGEHILERCVCEVILSPQVVSLILCSDGLSRHRWCQSDVCLCVRICFGFCPPWVCTSDVGSVLVWPEHSLLKESVGKLIIRVFFCPATG